MSISCSYSKCPVQNCLFRESEEFINYLSSRDVTFEYWVTSGRNKMGIVDFEREIKLNFNMYEHYLMFLGDKLGYKRPLTI